MQNVLEVLSYVAIEGSNMEAGMLLLRHMQPHGARASICTAR